MSENEELIKLKGKRTISRRSTTIIVNKLKEALEAENIDRETVESNLDQLLSKENILASLNDEIENLIPVDDLEDDYTTSQEYVENIILWKGKAQRYLRRTEAPKIGINEQENKSQTNTSEITIPETSVRLPRLETQRYFGDPTRWLEFWGQFSSTIHENKSLNAINKFSYLKSYLGGNAASAIAGLTLTESNYTTAINILQDRYGNKEVVISSHMNKLLSLLPVKRLNDTVGLRKLHDRIEIQVRSLESLGVISETYGQLLCPLILKLIPNELVLEFNKHRESEKLWSVSEIMKFLKREIQSREQSITICGNSQIESKPFQSNSNYPNTFNKRYDRPHYNKEKMKTNKFIPSATELIAASTSKAINNKYCIYCEKKTDHLSDDCEIISIEDKKQKLRDKSLCYLCLGRHYVRNCVKETSCPVCSKKHNKSICYMKYPMQQVQVNHSESNESSSKPQDMVMNSYHKQDQIYLQTASAIIVNSHKKCHNARVLYDNAATRSFITEETFQNINTPVIGNETLKVHGFASESPIEKNYVKTKIRLKSIYGNWETEIDVLVTGKITNALIAFPEEKVQRHLIERGLKLADFKMPNQDMNISILIGSDFYWKFVTGNIIRLDSTLSAVETTLGWCLGGRSEKMNSEGEISVNLSIEENEISKQLREFWELQNLGIKPSEAENTVGSDQEVLEQFNSTIKCENGRYKVTFPWKENMKERLADNYEVAIKRLRGLIVKFRKNPPLFDQYRDVLQDYLEQGIIEEIPISSDINKNVLYYIPYHGVLKVGKSTNLRIVFDASCRSEGNISLNDCLHAGPNLNLELLQLLVKFRENKIAFISDIKQAFLQCVLHETERDVTRFLWIENPFVREELQKIITYRFTRVLFGVTSSPFLLAAIIKHHLKRYQYQYPQTCVLLNNSFYVDDFVSGCDTVEEGLKTSLESIEIMEKAGMQLTKWQTNSKELEAQWKKFGVQLDDSPKTVAQNSTSLKVLGIAWDTKADDFYFDPTKLLEFLENQDCTKRFVLQVASRLFDPAGYLNPYIIKVKCLLQEIWCSGVNWDEKLPDQLENKWITWCNELQDLNKLSIPRYYMKDVKGGETPILTELHSFSDASIKAYGTVLYLRIVTNTGNICTSFVSSKTRVAPLKPITLPRLELMGALLAARLSCKISEYLKYSVKNFYWTDSTVTLYWIRGVPNKFKPFVQNRVHEIQSITEPSQWLHCPGPENPADILSRGMSVKDMRNSERWWYGPNFLRKPPEEWPVQPEGIFVDEATDTELRSKFKETIQYSLVTASAEQLLNVDRYSSLSKLLRVTAWMKRFAFNARNTERKTGTITAEELQEAEIFWVKNEQVNNFEREINSLKENTINKDSSIYNLAPYLDDKGIIRVGGRLRDAFTENESHPMILPPNSRFTELVIQRAHSEIMHSRVSATLAQVRKFYWVLRGRQQIKKILNKCLICQKYSAKPASQITAPLPKDRISETPPFYISGCDFAGPVYAKGKTGCEKTYIALFTCAVTRAVHLELVSDMSTDKFLMAFRRFTARRGVCQTIYSDNAKTYKRAERELKEIYDILKCKKFQDFIAKEGISWKYIVEKASWWGGFYERMVKSVKTCLRKVLGRSMLNFEELSTLLAEIESVINSRPLTYISDDVNEPEALTPAHFLTSKTSILIPPINPNILIKSSNITELTKRKIYRQRLLANMWRRWKEEYLMNLRSAFHLNKAQPERDIEIGDVVLLEGTPKSKLLWDLGVVREKRRGRDGHVRSCEVQTAGKTLRRPIQLLFPLELGLSGKD